MPNFDPASLDGLPEPVRNYLLHAIAPAAPIARGVRLRVRGRIRVGAWLRFDSVWEGDGRSFSWRAVSGPGPVPLLRVHDRFPDGAGAMDLRLNTPRRPLRVIHA